MAKDPPDNQLSTVPTLPAERVETISTSPLLLSVKRDEYIVVPPADHDRRLAIRYRDWGRLQGDIRRAGQSEHGFLAILWPLCFGVAATSLFSIMPMVSAKDLPAWVIPSYVAATVAGVALGSVFAFLHWKLAETVRGNLEEIIAEMGRIGAVPAEPGASAEG
jgi:hypothetical protein